MNDPGAAPAPALAPRPPADLEARIRSAERAAPPGDFGATGWFWLLLLGVALPLALWALGWWA